MLDLSTSIGGCYGNLWKAKTCIGTSYTSSNSCTRRDLWKKVAVFWVRYCEQIVGERSTSLQQSARNKEGKLQKRYVRHWKIVLKGNDNIIRQLHFSAARLQENSVRQSKKFDDGVTGVTYSSNDALTSQIFRKNNMRSAYSWKSVVLCSM